MSGEEPVDEEAVDEEPTAELAAPHASVATRTNENSAITGMVMKPSGSTHLAVQGASSEQEVLCSGKSCSCTW